MTYKPAFQDIAHLGHVEVLTPKLEESVAFFKDIMGLHESGRAGDSVYLRAWGDYALHTLQLTGAKTSGLGHMAFRTKSAALLDAMVAYLHANNVAGKWQEPEFGQGPVLSFCFARTATRWSSTSKPNDFSPRATRSPASRICLSVTRRTASRPSVSITSTFWPRTSKPAASSSATCWACASPSRSSSRAAPRWARGWPPP